MLKKIGFATALLVAGSASAFAQDTCQAPATPVVIDGATASKDQILAGVKAVKDYIAASDVYQSCVGDYIAAQKAQAEKDKKPVDSAMIQAELDKVATNQNSKQTVGDAINVSIGAYKKAHP